MGIAGMGNSIQKETKGQETAENYVMRSFILIFIGYLEFRIKVMKWLRHLALRVETLNVYIILVL
jgi:hypothetical protein